MPEQVAEQWAARIEAAHPAHRSILAGERDGVPAPWGAHAVLAYAADVDLVDMEDIAGWRRIEQDRQARPATG